MVNIKAICGFVSLFIVYSVFAADCSIDYDCNTPKTIWDNNLNKEVSNKDYYDYQCCSSSDCCPFNVNDDNCYNICDVKTISPQLISNVPPERIRELIEKELTSEQQAHITKEQILYDITLLNEFEDLKGLNQDVFQEAIKEHYEISDLRVSVWEGGFELNFLDNILTSGVGEYAVNIDLNSFKGYDYSFELMGILKNNIPVPKLLIKMGQTIIVLESEGEINIKFQNGRLNINDVEYYLDGNNFEFSYKENILSVSTGDGSISYKKGENNIIITGKADISEKSILLKDNSEFIQYPANEEPYVANTIRIVTFDEATRIYHEKYDLNIANVGLGYEPIQESIVLINKVNDEYVVVSNNKADLEIHNRGTSILIKDDLPYLLMEDLLANAAAGISGGKVVILDEIIAWFYQLDEKGLMHMFELTKGTTDFRCYNHGGNCQSECEVFLDGFCSGLKCCLSNLNEEHLIDIGLEEMEELSFGECPMGLMEFGNMDEPLKQDGRYLTYKGEKVTLVAYGNYIMVADPDFNYKAFMDTIKKNHINMVRVWGMAQMGHLGYSPFAGSPGNFNLNGFSDTYFKRLKEFVDYAEQNGIIVQIALFDSWGLKGTSEAHQWQVSPYNRNNGGLFNSGAQVCSSSANQINEMYVRKFASELGNYNNVIYEVMNEPDQLNGCEDGWHSFIVSILDNELNKFKGSKIISANEFGKSNSRVNIVSFHHPESVESAIVSIEKPVIISDDGWGFSCGDSGSGEEIIRAKQAISFCAHYEHLDGSFEYGDGPNGIIRRLRGFRTSSSF